MHAPFCFCNRDALCLLGCRKCVLVIFYSRFFLPWFRRLVAVFSNLCPGFDLRLVHVRFVVHTVALGQVSLPVLHFSPVSIIPPVLHASLHVHVALTGRTNGRSLGTFKKQRCSGNRGALVRKVFSLLCAVVWRAARCDRYGGTGTGTPSATTTSKV